MPPISDLSFARGDVASPEKCLYPSTLSNRPYKFDFKKLRCRLDMEKKSLPIVKLKLTVLTTRESCSVHSPGVAVVTFSYLFT